MIRDAVEGAEGVWGISTGDGEVGVADEGVPDFDGAAAFKDVDPDRTSSMLKVKV